MAAIRGRIHSGLAAPQRRRRTARRHRHQPDHRLERSFFVCQDKLLGSYARQIDIALDDGQPDSGSVRLCRRRSNGSHHAANLNDSDPYTVCASY
jgi:hypothetical protein